MSASLIFNDLISLFFNVVAVVGVSNAVIGLATCKDVDAKRYAIMTLANLAGKTPAASTISFWHPLTVPFDGSERGNTGSSHT